MHSDRIASARLGGAPRRSPASRRGSYALALLALVLLFVAGQAAALPMCIPPASGVPALSGAPQWWDASAGEPNYWPRLDDPRWRGALARSFGSGANEHVSFRALRDAGALYLSWHVKVDPNLEPFVDALRVGFSPGGTAPDALIEVFPFTSASSSLVAAVPPSTGTQLRTGAGGSWTPQASEPAWLATAAGFTRVWLDVPGQTWAINMRVPVAVAYDSGINLSGSFRIWFELQTSLPDGGVVFYRLDAQTYDDILSGTNASGWPEFSRTLAISDPSCVQGISIASSGVGTRFVDSGGVARPNRIDINGTNTVFAEPTNNTGGLVNAGQVQGVFRIANWGTQPDWNDVTDPTNSLWKQINTSAVTNDGAIVSGATASQAAGNDLSFPWTLTAAERCEFTGQVGVPGQVAGNPACPNVNPTRRLHQCMLVELSGSGFTYTPASVYRNMDYVDASTFSRQAQVSVAGLTPVPGVSRRDVYLYVKTYQMPKDITADPRPDLLRDVDKLRQILIRQDAVATHVRRLDAAEMMVASVPQEKLPARPPLGVPFDTLNQLYPTYVVHAYRDTGKKVMVRGTERRVMVPQSSFGYYVNHEGALGGWDTELQGATEVAKDYYLVRPPEGGSTEVRTSVTARPEGGPPCGCFDVSCWIKRN